MTATGLPSILTSGEALTKTQLVLLCAIGALLAGCAETRIRRESQEALQSGKYEQAVQQLESGLKDNPESTVLRTGLIQARTEAAARIGADVGVLRAQGRLDEAQTLLARAQTLEPRNERWAALAAELETERRQRRALAEAERLAAAQQPDLALLEIGRALKDQPRHPGLLQLQRKLETELRDQQHQSNQAGLAESRPISLDFREAPLRTVLDVVSRNSGVNFVLDKDIRPDVRVTVYLRESRVEDALDLIIGTNQLAKKVIDSQTVLIYPNTADKQREHQEQLVRVFYLANAEAKAAAAFLRAMLKSKEPFVDERSNMLALRDSPENIRLAERLIALFDTSEPEVLLEVEVLEVSSTRLTDLGINFPDTFSLTPLAPTGVNGLTLGNVGGINRDRLGLTVGSLLINLKREVGDVTTLANPRIRVRSKEKAKVLIGDKIPVVTATVGTGGFVSDSVNYLDVGLKLDVEPIVYPNDEVVIKIGLEVSSQGAATKTSSGTLAYQIGTRNANTMLRLTDGETQLLAGLISRDERTAASRVPGVGDLPVLGRLFSSQQDTGQRTELVLAITPRILRNIRRPDATETELWVGTEAFPRLKLNQRPRSVATAGPSPLAASKRNPAESAGPLQAPGPGLGAEKPRGASEAAPGLMPSAAALASEPASVSQTASTSAVRLQWAPAPNEVKVGQLFEVRLNLGTNGNVRGLPVDLSFDAERLEFVEVVEGDFFRRDGTATSMSRSVDIKAGRMRIGVLRHQASGVTGDAGLLTLRLKAKATGVAPLRVDSAQPVSLNSDAPIVQLPQPLLIQVK